MSASAQVLARTIKAVQNVSKSPRWGGWVGVIDPGAEIFDPFIFLVHHVHSFPPGQITGFPPHPHRGFETVTYCIEGGFDHGDSRGNKGRYGDGDVQWMTAGSGVLHSEMFVTKRTQPTKFNGFQLWLNLPQKLKMTEPAYQMTWKNDMKEISLKSTTPVTSTSNSRVSGCCKEGAVAIKILAGIVNDVKSPIEKSTPVTFLHVKIDPKTQWYYEVPSDHTCLIYVLSGKGQFGPKQTEAANQQYILFNNDGSQVEVANVGDLVLDMVLLAGIPFKEPIAHQGPFVMNTREELRQAAYDYQMGKFGDMDEPYIQPFED